MRRDVKGAIGLNWNATVHIVDPDYRRRARLARDLQLRGQHPEIYDNLDEFVAARPSQGFIFAFEGGEGEGEKHGDLLKRIEAITPYLPVILYSEDPKLESVVAAIRSGAFDYLKWPLSPQTLDRTLVRLGEGDQTEMVLRRRRADAQMAIARLSKREREVLVGLLTGLTNNGIAVSLGISSRTVEIHRRNMMVKLRASSPAAATRTAIYAGLDQEADALQAREKATAKGGPG